MACTLPSGSTGVVIYYSRLSQTGGFVTFEDPVELVFPKTNGAYGLALGDINDDKLV